MGQTHHDSSDWTGNLCGWNESSPNSNVIPDTIPLYGIVKTTPGDPMTAQNLLRSTRTTYLLALVVALFASLALTTSNAAAGPRLNKAIHYTKLVAGWPLGYGKLQRVSIRRGNQVPSTKTLLAGEKFNIGEALNANEESEPAPNGPTTSKDAANNRKTVETHNIKYSADTITIETTDDYGFSGRYFLRRAGMIAMGGMVLTMIPMVPMSFLWVKGQIEGASSDSADNSDSGSDHGNMHMSEPDNTAEGKPSSPLQDEQAVSQQSTQQQPRQSQQVDRLREQLTALKAAPQQ